MQKIKIRLPATLTSFGPGVNSLGLAIGLYVNIEISPRDDEKLVVETSGEGAGRYALGLQHPVVLAMMRVFQRLEKAPRGINIKIDSQIPPDCGLGSEAALMAAGVIGANNLMGNVYNRQQVIQLAAQVSEQPDGAITSIVGGLTATLLDDDNNIIYRNLPVQTFKLMVVVPKFEKYKSPRISERVPIADATHNLQRMPLLLEALREGNLKLLAQTVEDKLHVPFITPNIAGYTHISEMARVAGVLGVTTSGNGPAMVILAEKGFDRISEVVETAFKNIGTPVQIWTLSVDTQGVVISMMQSRA